MTTSMRNLIREMPFPLPQRVQRWCNAVPKSNADPEIMQRMADEIAAATFARRLQEQKGSRDGRDTDMDSRRSYT